MTDILLQALAFRWEHASAVEDLALARQQLSQLQREHNALQGRHKRLRADFERIQEQHKALKRDHARLTADFEHVQRELDEERNIAWYKDLVRRRLSDSQSPEETIPEEVRKDLIKLCHPDKWSQGQPATELAHEITVKLAKRPPKRYA
jgi:predicted nuclease with TOPRIM domain